MGKHRLSVIVAVGADRYYNLSLMLHALSLQTFKDFEVVLCCDSQRGIESSIIHTAKGRGLCIQYSWLPRDPTRPNLGAINKNRGAVLAQSDLLVFVDSDVVLNSGALEAYAEDFQKFPRRALCGPYHWLPPMRVTTEDIELRWDDFVHARLPITHLPPYSHNVHPDPRIIPWDIVSPDALYCDYMRSIMILGGNWAIHREVFRNVGGLWEELQCGIDGAFGLALYQAGYSWSFDARSAGYHLYHERVSGIDGEASMNKIIERFHSDDTWLGKMDKSVGWHWDSRNG